MLRTPPDILITTPESLFLLLTSQGREMLRGVETVIVDEVHAVAGTKRGAHLALSLERLERVADQPFQRIGLSATQRPLEEIGRFVSGGRPIELVDAGTRKELDLEVVVALEDMREPGSDPGLSQPVLPDGVAMASGLRVDGALDLALDLPGAARPRAAAPLDDRLRQQPAARRAARPAAQRARRRDDRARPPRLARARAAGRDRGAAEGGADPVPRRHLVARARDRHGRRRPRDPGREPEVGRARAAAGRPRRPRPRRRLEGPHLPQVPRRPARVGRRREGDAGGPDRGDADPAQPARRARAADRRDLRRGRDLGRRPPRARARRLPVRRPRPRRSSRTCSTCSPAAIRRTSSPSCGRGSSGTAPPASSRAGRARGGSRSRTRARSPTAASSASSRSTAAAASASSTRRWSTRRARGRRSCSAPRPGGSRRSPATACSSRRRPGAPGAVPFWKGEGVGRPFELGEKIGRASREIVALSDAKALERLGGDYHLDPLAAKNLLTYLRDQAAANGGVVPSDRTIVVERFRDEIGDWRLCILTPFGARVHAPWAMALGARLRDALGLEVQSIWSDDGIALHLPEADVPPPIADLLLTPDEIEELVVQEVGQTALFGARFRENAARALLIPRRRPGPAHAALAAAAEGAEPAPGGAQLRLVPDRARDLPRVPAGRLRPARAEADPARPPDARARSRRGRDAVRLAVRLVAPLRLRRDVHVRGRHARRRAPRAGALARPRPAARAARAGGAARPARPGGAGRGRGAARRRSRARPTSCTISCAAAATCATTRSTRRTRPCSRPSGARCACGSPARSG